MGDVKDFGLLHNLSGISGVLCKDSEYIVFIQYSKGFGENIFRSILLI